MSRIPRLLLPLLLLGALLAAAACGGSSSGLADNKGGISGTGDFALGKPVEISSFGLAHPSYGESEAGGFVLNTLSPVFRIDFATATEGNPADYLDIRLTKADSGASVTLGDVRSNLRLQRSADGLVNHLVICKSPEAELRGKELAPGQTYLYSVSPAAGRRLFFEGREVPRLEGLIRTKRITLTYPAKADSTDSAVNLDQPGLSGLGSLTPTFLVHSAYPVAGEVGGALDRGLLDRVKIFVNGVVLDESNLRHIRLEASGAQAITATVMPDAPLQWAGSYRLALQPTAGFALMVGGIRQPVSTAELPGQMLVQTRFKPE